jgi:hypothetical protein
MFRSWPFPYFSQLFCISVRLPQFFIWSWRKSFLHSHIQETPQFEGTDQIRSEINRHPLDQGCFISAIGRIRWQLLHRAIPPHHAHYHHFCSSPALSPEDHEVHEIYSVPSFAYVCLSEIKPVDSLFFIDRILLNIVTWNGRHAANPANMAWENSRTPHNFVHALNAMLCLMPFARSSLGTEREPFLTDTAQPIGL